MLSLKFTVHVHTHTTTGDTPTINPSHNNCKHYVTRHPLTTLSAKKQLLYHKTRQVTSNFMQNMKNDFFWVPKPSVINGWSFGSYHDCESLTAKDGGRYVSVH